MLFYYAGGSVGITVSGYAYRHGGWPAVVGGGTVVLALTLLIAVLEIRESGRPAPQPVGEEGPAAGACSGARSPW